MPAPSTTADLLELIRKSGLVRGEALNKLVAENLPPEPAKAAGLLVARKQLTEFQARMLMVGRHRGFRLGPYTMTDLLGKGGMGAVYRAEHEILRKAVAVKVLGDGADPLTRERFHREARAAAALDHPNIVRTHDVSKDGELHYLVMDLVEGQTLDRVVATSGPLSTAEAADAVSQAAEGLQHAHERGFLHRDIKPANLIRTADGTVKILDMGLARSTDKSDELTAHLDNGAIVGTADYISPEQVLNDPNIDIRSDIYSLGATLFALLAGRPLFSGTTVSKLAQHQLKAPKLADLEETVPSGLLLVLKKMLAKKPADRYQTPAEVAAALDQWRTSDGPTPKSRPRLPKPADRRRPRWPVWVAGGVAAVGVGVALVFALSGGEKEQPKIPPVAGKPGPVIPPAPDVPDHIAPMPRLVADAPKPPTPVPVPPQLFRLDLSQVKPFRQAKGLTEAGLPRTATGLPRGASYQAYRKGATGEFAAVKDGDGVALAVANQTDQLSAQFYFNLESEMGVTLVPGGRYRLTVEYRTDPGGRGQFDMQTPTYKMVGRLPLPDTKGEWRTRAVSFERGADPLRATFDNLTFSADKPARVYLRKFEITAESPSDSAKAKPLYAFNTGTLKPFRQTRGGSSDMLLPNDETGLPKGVRYLAYKPDASGEFAAVRKGDGLVLAVANRTDLLSSQFNFELEAELGLKVAAGKKYRFTVEYCTDPGGGATFAIQTPPSKEKPGYNNLTQLSFEDTKGEWRTATGTFERGAEIVRATFNNVTHSAETPVWVYLRRFEIAPAQ